MLKNAMTVLILIKFGATIFSHQRRPSGERFCSEDEARTEGTLKRRIARDRLRFGPSVSCADTWPTFRREAAQDSPNAQFHV